MLNPKGKKIFVTGGAGFVGSNLVRELLLQGGEVHALIRPETSLWRIRDLISDLRVHPFDLEDFSALRKVVNEIRPEIIFHLAGSVHHPATLEERQNSLRSNILGTANLVEALMPHSFECLVYAGSSLEYGFKKEPMKESDLLEPSTPRGSIKAGATLLCQQFAREHRLPVVILRLFSVYGYWESPARLIPTAICSALQGKELLLTPAGFRRDFVFIEDVVEACMLASQATHLFGEIINIGSGIQWSNEEVVNFVQTLTRRVMKIKPGEYPPRVSDTADWVANIQKAAAVLGWRPRHTLQDGLVKMITWFRDHMNDYA